MKYQKQAKRQNVKKRVSEQNISEQYMNANQSRNQSRKSNVKRHRRRHKKNYILHYIILLFLFSVVLITMSFTVLFNIKEIKITENTKINKDEVISSSGVAIGDNLLRIKKSKIESNILKSSIFLDGVDVKRKFPSTLNIALDIAKPTIGVNYDQKYYYFSKKGRLIEISETNAHSDIIVFWGVDLEKIKLGEYLKPNDKNEYEIAIKIKDSLKEASLEKIEACDLRNPAYIKLYYASQIEVVLGNLNDIDYKLKMAKKVIDTEITYGETGVLDVQISGKAYFRGKENIKHPS